MYLNCFVKQPIVTVAAFVGLTVFSPLTLAKEDPNPRLTRAELMEELSDECQSPLARQLAQISVHSNDPLMEANFDLASRCGLEAISVYNRMIGTGRQVRARGENIAPIDGLINFETPHVHPMDITPNGDVLVSVNTAAHRLDVWQIAGSNLSLVASIPVGIDPVSVRARSNNEVWVVNHMSDSVSVIDLGLQTVVRTLATNNEPADVVFSNSTQRAFVTASEANLVHVFNLADLDQPPQSLSIQGEDPRALAVSDNGNTVYAAVFESGNNTGLTGATGFSGGGSIVRGIGLADNDVAVIDANSLSVNYRRGLMNMVMALDVHPVTQQVHVVGTEAFNEIATEPALNGKFIKVEMAGFTGPGNSGLSKTDLNPHLDYTSANVSNRSLSIGDPRGIAWRADGQRAFITGMGSNNVVVVDASGDRVEHFNVGEGPTGVVLKPGTNFGYVMNKFDGSISVIDTQNLSQIRQVTFDDPTPAVIKAGRPLLYDTHLTSGTGHTSCASCHVDAKTDRLGWQLSDPSGPDMTIPRASNFLPGNVVDNITISSNKDVMTTQTLIDIMEHPRFHWRGDRENIDDFNATFVNLMGRSSQISAAQMTALKDYLRTMWLPPNPYRNIDNSRPTTVTIPNGTTATSNRVLAGQTNALRGGGNTNNCLACHSGQGNATRNFGANPEIGSNIIAPSLPGLYDKMGFTFGRSGFGFFHNGGADLFEATRTREFMAEILTLEGPEGPLVGDEIRQAPHAGVGQQVTLNGAVTAAQTNRLNQFISIAENSSWAELIAHARVNSLQRGYVYRTGSVFDADSEGDTETTTSLVSLAASGNPVTFTIVATGMSTRLALDSDLDGTLNNTNIEPDFDGDGIPDSLDPDDDNDGVPDVDDLDPFDPTIGAGGNGDGSLEPGESISASTAQGQWTFYSVANVAEFDSLAISLSGLSADIDLYVRDSAEPDLETYDCRSWNGGTSAEQCSAEANNTIIIGVFGYRAGNYTLGVAGVGGSTGGSTDGTSTAGSNQIIMPGEAVTATLVQNEWAYFTVAGVQAGEQLAASLTGLSNDLDLYVRDGDIPSLGTYDCRSWNGNTDDELCEVSASDNLIIGVFGYRAGTFTLQLDGAGGSTAGSTDSGSTDSGNTDSGNTDSGSTDGGTTGTGSDNTIAVGGSESGAVGLGEWQIFEVDNTAGVENGLASLTGLSADIDLYVRIGSAPTLDTFDCRSWVGNTGDESCGVNLASGTAFIGVHGYQSGSFTLSLAGGADVSVINLGDTSNSAVAQSSWNYYRVSDSNSVASVISDLTNLQADSDLYMKIGALPSLTDFDCRSFAGSTSDESCSVNPQGLDVYVGVYGFAPSTYTLAVDGSDNSNRKGQAKPRTKSEITADLKSKGLLQTVSVGGGAAYWLLAIMLIAVLRLVTVCFKPVRFTHQ